MYKRQIYDFTGARLAALTTPTSVVPTTIVLDRAHRPAVVYLRAVEAVELKAAIDDDARRQGVSSHAWMVRTLAEATERARLREQHVQLEWPMSEDIKAYINDETAIRAG